MEGEDRPLAFVAQFPLAGRKEAIGFTFAVKPEPGVVGHMLGTEAGTWQQKIGKVLYKTMDRFFSPDAATRQKAVDELTDALRTLNASSPIQVADAGGVPAVQIDDTRGNRLEISFGADVAAVRVTAGAKATVYKTSNATLLRIFNAQSRAPDATRRYIPKAAESVSYGGVYPASHARFDFHGPIRAGFHP